MNDGDLREIVSTLEPWARAALIAAALTRADGFLRALGAGWRELRVPTTRIIERFTAISERGVTGAVDWKLDHDQMPRTDTQLGEVLESGLELFALANRALEQLDLGSCVSSMEAAVELAEAADNLMNSPSTSGSVEVDTGDPTAVHEERMHQLSDAKILSVRTQSIPSSALTTINEKARQIGSERATRLSTMRAQHLTSSADPVATSLRPRVLLKALVQFTDNNWKAVDVCARELDRPTALAAARLAMKAIGIHTSHELLRAASTELRLQEGTMRWEVASRALLAAAAWDRLEDSPRYELMRCLVSHQQIKNLLSQWTADS